MKLGDSILDAAVVGMLMAAGAVPVWLVCYLLGQTQSLLAAVSAAFAVGALVHLVIDRLGDRR